MGIPKYHSHSNSNFTHLTRICECTTPAGGKLTSVPEKKPYNIANTMNPYHVEMPSQSNRSVPEAITVGMRILIGPAMSAMKFGNIRPKTDAAYN
jgi:hypothetical protein